MAAEFFYIFVPAAFSEGVEKIYIPPDQIASAALQSKKK